MSRLDDSRDVMPLPSLSDEEVEIILSGATLQRSDARDLEAFVGALAMTARLEQARPSAARMLAETARMARPESVSPLWSRAAMLAATLGLVVTLGGVAVAADGAVPGDLLYPIDRALEAIGVGDTGVDERIAEIDTLLARGDHERAQTLLEDLVDSAHDDTASEGVPSSQVRDDPDEPTEITTSSSTPSNAGKKTEPKDSGIDPAIGSDPGNGSGDDPANPPEHAGVPGQANPDPGNPDQGAGSASGNNGQGNGNQESPPGQGDGNQGDGNQGDGDQGQGTGNQGQGAGDQGQGSDDQGSQGSPPGQGNGNQGQSSGNQGNQGQG